MNNVTNVVSNSPIKMIDKFTNTNTVKVDKKNTKKPIEQQVQIKQPKVNVQLDEKLVKINQKISGEDRAIEYMFHKKTKTLIFKVVDSKTGEVIKEIPSEKLLDMAADVWEQYGLIVDKKV